MEKSGSIWLRFLIYFGFGFITGLAIPHGFVWLPVVIALLALVIAAKKILNFANIVLTGLGIGVGFGVTAGWAAGLIAAIAVVALLYAAFKHNQQKSTQPVAK